MAWTIEFERSAERELSNLGHDAAKRLLKFLHERVASLDDPRSIGGSLKGQSLGSFWKYRIGDYRVVAHIDDVNMLILIVRVGHRSAVYRR